LPAPADPGLVGWSALWAKAIQIHGKLATAHLRHPFDA